MVPTTKKSKHVRIAPDFMDDALIATLSKEKQEYWANRKAGKNGIPTAEPKVNVVKTPNDINMGFDNNGKMVAKTRTMRRQKPITDPKYTKKQPTRKK